jgi:glycosidase
MSENGATLAGLKLANTFVLTTRGVPQLYYGDEIAMTGPDEPTTRGDFPGGFPGDKRNAFTYEGRTREENEIFDHIRKLNQVRAELQPLRQGELINLYAGGQQYAYARQTKGQVAIVVINNDKKTPTIEIDVSRLELANGTLLNDRLLRIRAVRVRDGKLQVTLPERSAAILVRQ